MISQDSYTGSSHERTALLADAIQQGKNVQRFVHPDIKAELAELPYRSEETLFADLPAESASPVQLDPPPIEQPQRRSIPEQIACELQRPFRRLLQRLISFAGLQPVPPPAEPQPDLLAEFRQILASYEQKIHDLEANYCSMLASDRLNYHDSSLVPPRGNEHHSLSDQSIECLFVHTRLPAPPARVLVLGCGQSKMAIELASLGFDVVEVDRAPVALQHPNLTVIQTNAPDLPVAAESFAVVVSVSPLASEQASEEQKRTAALQMTTQVLHTLRREGTFLLAAPYTTATQAIDSALTPSLLQTVTHPFHVCEMSYALLAGKCWQVTSNEEAARQNLSPQHVSTLVLVAMQKG